MENVDTNARNNRNTPKSTPAMMRADKQTKAAPTILRWSGLNQVESGGVDASVPIFFVSESKLTLNFGDLLKLIEELTDAEIGHDEFAKLESGGKRLLAHGDHPLHVLRACVNVAHIHLHPVLGEKGKGFPAPGATGLDIQNGHLGSFMFP